MTGRTLDVASLALLVLGLAFGALSYWLITNRGLNALILIPSIVAATTGATHLFKRQAPPELEGGDHGLV